MAKVANTAFQLNCREKFCPGSTRDLRNFIPNSRLSSLHGLPFS
jgi:hypothetical protein